MKKIILILLLTSFNVTVSNTCQCGSYESGTYHYEIVEESGGCCSGIAKGLGIANENAVKLSYERNEGAWVVSDRTFIKPHNAQDECCSENV